MSAGSCTRPHALSPYFLEGTKTFAYEVFRQTGGELPGHVVFPVGNGSLLLGAHKGFGELRGAGLIPDVPKLHCVQTEAVRPIAAAAAGEAWSAADAGKTVAGGIAVASPPRLRQIVDAVGASGGAAVTADEASIAAWQWRLAGREGVFAEPTSAAAFAGLARAWLPKAPSPRTIRCSCRSRAPARRTAPRRAAVPAGGALCRLNGPPTARPLHSRQLLSALSVTVQTFSEIAPGRPGVEAGCKPAATGAASSSWLAVSRAEATSSTLNSYLSRVTVQS